MIRPKNKMFLLITPIGMDCGGGWDWEGDYDEIIVNKWTRNSLNGNRCAIIFLVLEFMKSNYISFSMPIHRLNPNQVDDCDCDSWSSSAAVFMIQFKINHGEINKHKRKQFHLCNNWHNNTRSAHMFITWQRDGLGDDDSIVSANNSVESWFLLILGAVYEMLFIRLISLFSMLLRNQTTPSLFILPHYLPTHRVQSHFVFIPQLILFAHSSIMQ